MLKIANLKTLVWKKYRKNWWGYLEKSCTCSSKKNGLTYWHFYQVFHKCWNIWDKVFKSGPSKICGRQPLKNLKGWSLLVTLVSNCSFTECWPEGHSESRQTSKIEHFTKIVNDLKPLNILTKIFRYYSGFWIRLWFPYKCWFLTTDDDYQLVFTFTIQCYRCIVYIALI